MADTLEELYDKYNILSDAKDKVAEHSKEYEYCIDGIKGGPKEKKLAAQIIQKFFKHFPALQERALNAILDLCEEEDSSIRIQAMKILPLICKEAKEYVNNIASILSQLLQLEDQDYTTACNSLMQVYKEDPTNTIKGILSNINVATSPATEDPVREKCIQFLFKKLVKSQEKLTTELEDLLIEEAKKIIQDSNANEFITVMPFLTSSKMAKTIAGQQELVDLVAERAEINVDFEPLEEGNNNVDRIIMCVESILPIFNANVESTKFVKYYCEQILSHWKEIEKIEVERGNELLRLMLLRQLAELTSHCGKLEEPTTCVTKIFEKIKEYMPPPPENADVTEMPNLDFTTVECLLYAFHRLARQCPDFLTADQELLKDFRSRLTYFSRGVQGCKRGLEKTLSSKKDLTDENAEKVKIAPAVLDNITALIKDLFYKPPVYKCNVQLSFKKEKAKVAEKSPTNKRHAPITFDSSNGSQAKQSRYKSGENMKLYTPPSGKFSNNFSSKPSGMRGGRGRGIRGGLSRGRARGWRN